jgi:hypothetical protein
MFVALSLSASESVAPLAGEIVAPPGGRLPPAPAPLAIGDARLIAALRSKIPLEPIAVDRNPYLTWRTEEPPRTPVGTVCGVRFESDRIHYRLATFGDTVMAQRAGFAVTHFGTCGTCSTLQDLAVYLEKPDLTSPVRKCGIKWDASASLSCLEALGFSPGCAQTWLYDVQNTRRQCFGVCVWSWIKREASTREDGRLNACLQCDEDRSGPIFKAVAGRTRRNSGIRSSIPRASDEIAPVVHDYVPDLEPR